MSIDELIDFFQPPPVNIEELGKQQGKVDITKLDKIIKKGEILRIRPDTYHTESFYGVYQTDGNVLYEGEIITLIEFLKKTRKKSRYLYHCPQTRSTTNPLRYIEVYTNGHWEFILKIVDPKATVPEKATINDLMYGDMMYWGGVSYRHLSDFETLPTKWVEDYEKRLQSLYTIDEPVSSDPIITRQYVDKMINKGEES